MELEDSWSNYDNRMCLGSGKELNEDDDSYDIKCKTNNPIIFEKFPSVLFKIKGLFYYFCSSSLYLLYILSYCFH